jgi:Flp pilus assembly protein TadD
MFSWFNAREATALGSALADQYLSGMAAAEAARGKKAVSKGQSTLEELLRRADGELRKLNLNFYKKAKFANTFKWRLLEKGIERQLADEVTQMLVMRVSAEGGPARGGEALSGRAKLRDLLEAGSICLHRRDYIGAAANFAEFLQRKPRHADAHNLLGSALAQLGNLGEAEGHFRRAIALAPKDAAAHSNLGNLYRVVGNLEKAANSLRRALHLEPGMADARLGLGRVLLLQGHLRDSQAHFSRILKADARHVEALLGLGEGTLMEGRFDEAEKLFKRALEVEPEAPAAWANLASLRKMGPADRAWLERVQELASKVEEPLQQANLRFAMGKYFDDTKDFDSAFENYQRGNQLMRQFAKPYARQEHAAFVDDLLKAYSPQTFASIGAGGSDSALPVLVVGMPRSGTSLVEQIIASHPAAHGAGELLYWTEAVRQHEAGVRRGSFDASVRAALAQGYLSLLRRHSADAARIVDKAPANLEYLGPIHSVFPRARIIYMRRDPIDTCLSCYFQQFSAALSFTMDLGDLAHYYGEFHRLIAHWKAVLPAGTILEVPYEELVADQQAWTRKILDFLGLPWDERCLNFHQTERAVATASTWQVRQKMHRGSVERWRNYGKHLGPLLELRKLV